MKKVLLTAMAILTVASASVFGMYGATSDWIDFLVHGNQLRVRMDRLGFVLGNDTIRGTFGFRYDGGVPAKHFGSIFTKQGDSVSAVPTISGGLGYTSDMFSIGVGYGFGYVNKNLFSHTPVITFTALDDSLRVAIPVTIASSDNADNDAVANDITTKKGYLGINTDVQIRYYTGIDAFNLIRFHLFYGQNGYKVGTTEYSAQSLGFQLRLYFLKTQIGNVTINPYVRAEFHTALGAEGKTGTLDQYGNLSGASTGVTAISTGLGTHTANTATHANQIYASNPWKFVLRPTLQLAASSDYVSFIFEPRLGYVASSSGKQDALRRAEEVKHSLAWGAYAELYLTPVKDLEWYFEIDVGDPSSVNEAVNNTALNTGVYFETSTGITWYLPSFGAEQ